MVPPEPAASNGPPRMPSPRTPDALFTLLQRTMSAGRAISVIAVCVTIIAIIAVGFALHTARPIMMPLTAAFVLSLILAPAADWLGRRGLPEGLRAAIVVFAAMGAIFVGIYLVGKPAVAWSNKLPAVVEEARGKLSGLFDAVTQMQEVGEQVEEIASNGNGKTEPREVIVRGNSLPLSLAASARTIIVQLLFTAVLAYFLLETKSGFHANAIAARRTMRGKLQTARILRNMQKKVGVYMFTMLMINIGLGGCVAACLSAIGMPSPLVWGLLAAILNFVPYVGPAIVTVLLGLSGLVEYDTLKMAAAPVLIYVVLNFIESNFVTPLFIGVRLRISPLAILIAIAIFIWMWGPVGSLLAIPLVVVLKTICDSVPALKPIGVFIGDIKVVKGRKVDVWGVHTVPARAVAPPPPPRRPHAQRVRTTAASEPPAPRH